MILVSVLKSGKKLVDLTGIESVTPLPAKTRKRIYLVGSLGFIPCRSIRFCTYFGGKWSEAGPKLSNLVVEMEVQNTLRLPCDDV